MIYRTQESARKAADEARQTMANPDRWAVRIWENLGWHWALECRNVAVQPSRSGTYSALISNREDDCGTGLSAWTKTGHYLTPQQAVDMAYEDAHQYVQGLRRALDAACLALTLTASE